jgi:malate dehydrogenase (oxaloacetate-decarboxylating)(NADP+)
VRLLLNRAKTNPKRVVFAEADQLNVLKAAQIVYDEGVAHPILLGREDVIRQLMTEIDFEANIPI